MPQFVAANFINRSVSIIWYFGENKNAKSFLFFGSGLLDCD